MRKLWTILTLVAAMLFVSVAAAQVGTAVGVSTTSAKGTAARSHNVNVTIPEVILLKLNGSNNGTVTFDFNTEAQVYANAALASTPLNPTASDMTGLQVFTNDNGGAKVQITLSGGTAVQGDLRFDNKTLTNWNASHDGSTVANSYPGNTAGFQDVFSTSFAQSGGVVTSSPITFVPSTSDTPGSYTITVTYTATAL